MRCTVSCDIYDGIAEDIQKALQYGVSGNFLLYHLRRAIHALYAQFENILDLRSIMAMLHKGMSKGTL